MISLQFEQHQLTKPPTSGIDAETTLLNFAIITYYVDPEKLQRHLPDRFQPTCVFDKQGNEKALISVVPFFDTDFRYAKFPWCRWAFGQTNYRAYVLDRETNEQVAWFFGTALDSFAVAVPRFCWKLPWHRASIRFDCQFDQLENRYRHYRMKTKSRWANAEVELEDTGIAPNALQGFADVESSMVLLTHPLRGYYYRRDGKLGSYHIWHKQIKPTVGEAKKLYFPLLEKLELVSLGDLTNVHSVLLQHRIDFTIYLPPKRV